MLSLFHNALSTLADAAGQGTLTPSPDNTFSKAIVAFMDAIIGWTLNFQHLTIIILLGTTEALILTLIPKFVTNQDRLKRGNFDKKRLNQLIKEAKKKGDKDAIKRYRATIGSITSMTLKAQGLPLLISLIPVLFIALWAFGRIAYEPPQPGENVMIHAYFPTSQIGNLAHMVPQNGLQLLVPKDPAKPTDNPADYVPAPARSGTLDHAASPKTAIPPGTGPVIDGWATWVVKPDQKGPYSIVVRYKGQTAEKPSSSARQFDTKNASPILRNPAAEIKSLENRHARLQAHGPHPSSLPIPLPSIPQLPLPRLVASHDRRSPLAFSLKPLLRVY